MDSLWLKATLRAKKITQRSLGEAINLSQDKINKALAHVRQFSTIEAIKIAEYLEQFQINREETLKAILGKDMAFLQKIGERAESGFQPLPSSLSKPIPIVGNVISSGAIVPLEANTKIEYAEPISSSASSPVAIRIKSEAFAPTHHDGDILYYDDHGKIENTAIGKEAVVELTDGQKFLCTPKRSTMASP